MERDCKELRSFSQSGVHAVGKKLRKTISDHGKGNISSD
ncbi:hypothetical protein DOT_3680 [Desulfosporosinus sp. OT]|nr:hypothetical protein DOT_3680 [Desulfosporosinus sp. OT]